MESEKEKRGFGSDNNSGIHPDILKGIVNANVGHVVGYGADRYTEEALNAFRKHFGEATETYFVFTGTAANVLGLSAITRSWNSVITASTSHLEVDECGAPEKFIGCKVLVSETSDGKLTPELIERHIHGIGFEHHSQPGIVSITQSTEVGTVYQTEEIKAIAQYVHSKGLLLHMDGARLGNAAVSLNLPFRKFTTDAGVDILSFGGTKNGMMFGEAICFLKPGLSQNFKYIRKQAMQLASKMRFISAQYIEYFKDDLWKKCAAHSNNMASVLAHKLEEIPGIKITQKVESNGVFVIIPDTVAERIMKSYFFYVWDEKRSEYRLMTSWDTSIEDIDSFADILRKELNSRN